MSKNIRILYLYIVSFITLCMMVGSFVGIVNTTISYLYPTANYYGGYYPATTTKDYVSTDVNTGSGVISGDTSIYDEQKAIDAYKKGLADEELTQKRRSLKSIFGAIAVLVVATPLYIYHFGKIEKERKEEEVA